MVALLVLSYKYIVTINVLWLFLMVSWVGLQCVIVIFLDHTHLIFVTSITQCNFNSAAHTQPRALFIM